MKKSKYYDEVRFSADVLNEASRLFKEIAAKHSVDLENKLLSVEHDDSSWKHDTMEEFFADYRKFQGYAYYSIYGPDYDLDVDVRSRSSNVSVKAPSRSDIEAVFEVFEKHLKSSFLPEIPKPPAPKAQPLVFIGHGKSPLWRDLKDHLQDKHSIRAEAYETGARAGHTIRDILQELVSKSSFALLVLTAEDALADGTYHARQNVIHETGLFQGKLGFSRAIVLLEEGAEEFSNIHGIQQIRFSKGNIKETFGEVVATIRREFGSS